MRSAIVSGIVTGDALLSYLLLLANFFPCPKQQSKKSLWKLTRPSFLVSTVASVTPLSFFSDNASKQNHQREYDLEDGVWVIW